MVNREIAYIIASHEDPSDEFCIRNTCYKSHEDFKANCIKNIPLRIDIGAFFSSNV